MNKIIEKIQQHTDISYFSTNFISNLIKNRMVDLKLTTVNDYHSYLESNEAEIDILKSQFSNSYSMFFRNRLTFEVLKHLILPTILSKSTTVSEIRVWSAGCAAGHEAYSLAILFETFNSVSLKQLKYRIFATDKNYYVIEKAVLGDYQTSDLGNLTLTELDKWFTKAGKGYKINATIKQNVQFELFDLLNKECICPKTSIFGDFNIIMCANVLIYYNEDVQKQILSNFKRCLSANGIVISGETERDLFLKNGFLEVIPQSSIFKI